MTAPCADTVSDLFGAGSAAGTPQPRSGRARRRRPGRHARWAARTGAGALGYSAYRYDRKLDWSNDSELMGWSIARDLLGDEFARLSEDWAPDLTNREPNGALAHWDDASSTRPGSAPGLFCPATFLRRRRPAAGRPRVSRTTVERDIPVTDGIRGRDVSFNCGAGEHGGIPGICISSWIVPQFNGRPFRARSPAPS